MTSNDGFSVVAPMNVTSPCSTYGRNASCCALLKRCTSSTNRIVCRPDCASVASARATASRMSLTPESTADSAMNSALNALAISRASVVLPDARRTPQQHRMRLARSERDRERLARRQQMPLADHLVDGRRAQPIGERRRGIGGGEEIGHGALTRRKRGSVEWRIIRHFQVIAWTQHDSRGWFALLSAGVLVAAGFGAQFGLWDFRLGFQLVRWSEYTGLAAIALALIGLVVPRWRRGRVLHADRDARRRHRRRLVPVAMAAAARAASRRSTTSRRTWRIRRRSSR